VQLLYAVFYVLLEQHQLWLCARAGTPALYSHCWPCDSFACQA
jgi:hypothetical protein